MKLNIEYQGAKYVQADIDSLVNKVPESVLLPVAKSTKIGELSNEIKTHIESSYPEIKQRSDLADKEFFGSWLLTNVVDSNGNPAYSQDVLYQRAFMYGAQIWYGNQTLQQILSDIQTSELPSLSPAGSYGGTQTEWEQEFIFAWSQLIKIAVRIAFVQAYKNIYRQVKSQVEQVTTLQELSSISIPAFPDLPEEFR